MQRKEPKIIREIIEAPPLTAAGDSEFSQTLTGQIIRQISLREEARAHFEEMLFRLDDGRVFKLFHKQDCCEDVYLYDVGGDLDDLLDTPILAADEREYDSDTDPEEYAVDDTERESWTWTFYILRTIKGSVTLRWLGESNGYYSESMSFEEVTGKEGYN